jgi:hypothetical protein
MIAAPIENSVTKQSCAAIVSVQERRPPPAAPPNGSRIRASDA